MLVTTRSLDHHGIVSGIYDELEIGKVIDEVLPKRGQHKLPHSIVIKAMILNCLGFTDSRLYMSLNTLKPFLLKGYLVLESAYLTLLMMFWGVPLTRSTEQILLNFS
jgi:hypothetical protein